MQIELSIVIVSYNSWGDLKICLPSIYNNPPACTFEIILVDNNSDDLTADYIAVQYPEVKIIQSAENLGFAKANNLGVSKALGKHLFFLNPDTEVLPNAITNLFQFYRENTSLNIGIIGPEQLNWDGTIGNSAGNFPKLWQPFLELLPAKFYSNKLRAKQVGNQLLEVDYVAGSAMLCSKSTFDKIGGFDTSFFLYYEETELQHRLQVAGYKQFVFMGAQIKHRCGTTNHLVSKEKILHFEGGRVNYYRLVFGKSGERICRIALSLFYLSRSLLPRKRYYWEAWKQI